MFTHSFIVLIFFFPPDDSIQRTIIIKMVTIYENGLKCFSIIYSDILFLSNVELKRKMRALHRGKTVMIKYVVLEIM